MSGGGQEDFNEGVEESETVKIVINEAVYYSRGSVSEYAKEYKGKGELKNALRSGKWIRLGVETPKKAGEFLDLFKAGLHKMAGEIKEDEDIKGIFGVSPMFKRLKLLSESLGFTHAKFNEELAWISREDVIRRHGK